MKAITICQPYAHLICWIGEKRIENRSWHTRHKGALYIHAGRSRAFLRDGDESLYRGMPFGAMVGRVIMEACYHIETIRAGRIPAHHRWVIDHEHTEGPYCFVFSQVERVRCPIECRGGRGIWKVDQSIFRPGADTWERSPIV